MATYDRFYERGGYRLYYRHIVTHAGAPTFVLLHGLAGNQTSFVPLIKLLTEHGYNIVAPDLRGHGLSTKTRRRADYVWPEFVEDLHALLDDLGLPRVTMLGYSAGGTIALMHEQKYPGRVDRMILVGANHHRPLSYGPFGWLTRPGVALANAIARIARFHRPKKYKHLDLVQINGYWGSVYQGLRSMPVDVNLWLLANTAMLNITDLSRVAVPVLVLRGQGDNLFSQAEAEELVHKLPNGQLINVAGTGHYLVTHHERELHDLLQRFIQKQRNQ